MDQLGFDVFRKVICLAIAVGKKPTPASITHTTHNQGHMPVLIIGISLLLFEVSYLDSCP